MFRSVPCLSDLLVQHHPDQQRERIVRQQLVGLVDLAQVQSHVNHGSWTGRAVAPCGRTNGQAAVAPYQLFGDLAQARSTAGTPGDDGRNRCGSAGDRWLGMRTGILLPAMSHLCIRSL